MRIIEWIISAIITIFLCICVCYLDERLDNQQETNKVLQTQLNDVRTEFEAYKKADLQKQSETEKKIADCKRDTNTFVDIVVNGRWQ